MGDDKIYFHWIFCQNYPRETPVATGVVGRLGMISSDYHSIYLPLQW